MLEDKIQRLITKAMEGGASYVDVRLVKDNYELLDAKNGKPQRLSNLYRTGIGLRVMVEGAIGFASTTDITGNALSSLVKKAIKVASAASMATKKPRNLVPVDTYESTFITPVKEDPFEVETEEKISKLVIATKDLQAMDNRIRSATASMQNRKYYTHLVTSEGTDIKQTLIQCGISITGMVIGGSAGMHMRTNENYEAKGLEFVEEFDLPSQVEKIGKDLKLLADKAKKAPSGKFNLVLEPSHLGLVIHESVGHPSELDRVLGREADFAGTSFLKPKYLGEGFIYGSELVNIVNDPSEKSVLGSYGFDDDGVKSHRTYVIKDGIFKAFESDRVTAAEIGLDHSSGNSRAHGHDRLPIDRMANLYFEPNPKIAISSLEELLEEANEGIFALYSRTHSINETRTNFQFTTQMGYLIENGELTQPLKNVVYGSRTLDFWHSCAATTKNVEIYGTPNCGKGNPGQTIWTSHGGGHTLFKDIRIGA